MVQLFPSGCSVKLGILVDQQFHLQTMTTSRFSSLGILYYPCTYLPQAVVLGGVKDIGETAV